VRDGLTLLSTNEGAVDGTAYFFAEVRNDSGHYLSQVDAVIYSLDQNGLQIDEFSMGTLLTDIPPGQAFFVGRAYPLPDDAVDAQHWLWYTPTDQPRFRGVFNLPATVESQGPLEGAAYAVNGTVENTSENDLLFPVIDVALLGPDNTIVALTRGVLATSAADGTWPSGETARFEAIFPFASVPADQISDVRVSAAGYSVP